MTSDIQLETLEAKGLIRLAVLRPELEYLFRHALVQDAAYGSLLKQERRALHGQVGEALEALYPDRMTELSPVLAMHFEQAGEPEKAVEYYISGARHALARYAIEEAFGAFDRAATLMDQTSSPGPGLPPDEVARRRRRRIEVELGRAQAGYSFRKPEESFGALEEIVPAAEELGDPELVGRVHMLIALGRLQNGEPASAPLVKRSLDRITEIGEMAGDPSMRAMPLALVGLSQVFAGPVREGVAKLEEALPLIEGRQDSIGAAFARGALSIGYATLGEFDQAEAALAQTKAIAASGDLIAQLDALIDESYVRLLRGDLDGAAPIARQCVDRAEATGASACMVVSSWILGDAFHQQGRFVEARDILKRGADISMVVDRKVWRPTLQAWLGSAAAALGEIGDMDWDEALAMARSIGNRGGEAGILGKRAEAAAAGGDLDAAVADFEASAALLEEAGARPSLARVLRSWGEALRGAGRESDAVPILRRALALFEEMGLEREAGIVRTTLSLGATKLAFD
jgi:tetratricopeptide (TPR) repeat protein